MRAGKRERAAMWLKSDVDTDCEKARTSIPSSANARKRRRGQKETRTVALKTRDGVSETVEEENWRTRMEDEKDGRKERVAHGGGNETEATSAEGRDKRRDREKHEQIVDRADGGGSRVEQKERNSRGGDGGRVARPFGKRRRINFQKL